MQTYNVKFSVEFDTDIEADSLEIAEQLAKQNLALFPGDKCRLLSIDVAEESDPAPAVA